VLSFYSFHRRIFEIIKKAIEFYCFIDVYFPHKHHFKKYQAGRGCVITNMIRQNEKAVMKNLGDLGEKAIEAVME